MTIRDSLIEALGGVTMDAAEKRAMRAFEAGYEDGGEDEPVSGTTAKQGWRRGGVTGAGERALGGIDYDRVMDTAWRLYLSNPAADRILKVRRDYILGRGIQIQADDDDLQEILDAFWQDTHLDRRLSQFVLQRALLGEQLFPVFVRETDGRVRMGYIDPSEIARVITHPENVLEQWAVVLKERLIGGQDPWAQPQGRRVYRIVRKDEPVVNGDVVTHGQYDGLFVTAEQAILEDWEGSMLAAHGLREYSGTCFYFSINNLSNQPRGFSDLIQASDWLDRLDIVLDALADREAMADYFSFDLTLEGANEDDIAKRARVFRKNPPRKGSVNVHNEKEAWNLNRPDLKQTGSIESSDTLLQFIMGGIGLPIHWWSGEGTNRATAQEQALPAMRTMERQQDDVRDMVLDILHFVRDQAEIAGAWSGEDRDVTVVMPEMTSRNVAEISQALAQLANALVLAIGQGLMTQNKAIEVWAKGVAELGIDIDTAEEMAAMEEEEEEPMPDFPMEQQQATLGQQLVERWMAV